MNIRTYKIATISVLFLLFLLGLNTLGLPILDDHGWRQAISTMVSQNFVRHGYDLFHPLYDICGDVSPDVFGIEFPVMNLLIAWMYEVFGWNIAYARGVNLVVSMLGLYYLYLFVTRLLGERLAFYTAIFTAGSLYLMFSRKVMPDTFSLALVMASVYYIVRYLERPSWKFIVAGTVLGVLGVGSKLPSVMLYCFLLFPLLEGDIFARAKVHVVIGMIVIAGMVALWYFMWVPHIEETYTCFPLMYPVSLREGLVNFVNSSGKIGFRFTRAYTWWGPLVLFVLGVGKIIYMRNSRYGIFLLAYTIIMILYIAKTGRVFQNHNYYVIPAIPAMSLVIAYHLDGKVLRHWVFSVCIVVFALGYPLYDINKEVHYQVNTEYPRLKGILDKIGVAPRAKIMVNGHSLNPSMMYFTGRHGWNVDDDILTKYSWMPDYKRDGLEYIVVRKRTYKEKLKYTLIYEDEDFSVYKP